MKFVNQFVLGAIILFLFQVNSHATDMFGNPAVIGKMGKTELQIGGGMSSHLSLDTKTTTATTQIGSGAITQTLLAGTNTYKENQVFIGASYNVNARTQLLANIGTGKDTGSTGQSSSSYSLGIKISPDTDASQVKMGLILRAQKVSINIDGPFILSSPYNTVNNGVTTSYFYSINGNEQIKYNRMDAFFGASTNSGFFRPYGGFALSLISGTDKVVMRDTTGVTSSPSGGGAVTYSNQNVAFNAQSKVSGSKYITAVLGFSINPDSDFGMTAELQLGTQASLMFAGNVKF